MPVKFNQGRAFARVVFASKHDFGFLTQWRHALGEDRNPIRRDALEFAQLAVDRFASHSPIQPYAQSIQNMSDLIKTDQEGEVAAFALLKCDWFPDSAVIGYAHFRRTWANNIILDYLGAHPFAAQAAR